MIWLHFEDHGSYKIHNYNHSTLPYPYLKNSINIGVWQWFPIADSRNVLILNKALWCCFDISLVTFSVPFSGPTAVQIVLFSVGQTNWSKGGNAKEFRNCSMSEWTHLKGHQGELLWQHIRLKLILLCNKKKLKLREHSGGVGAAERMKHLSSQTTSKSQWSTEKESHKEWERGKSSETEWNWQRCKQRNTDRESKTKQERTLRQKFRKSRSEINREWQRNKERQMTY